MELYFHEQHAPWKDDPLAILPEEWLLFALAKVNPSAVDRQRAAAIVRQPRFSWDNAWDLAVRHWVHRIVAKNIQDEPDLFAQVPGHVRSLLGFSQFTTRVRQQAFLEETVPAFVELTDRGVPIALMKGAALLSRYPPDTRVLNDIDILIHKPDYPRVAACLEARGFRKVLSEHVLALGESDEYQLRTDHEMSFVKHSRHTLFAIDVHWAMHGPDVPFSTDTLSLLARARPVQFGPASIPALSLEDTLLNYAAQLITDELSLSFSRMVDIHAVVESGGVCWTAFCDRAIGAHAAGAGHLALAAAGLLGAEVPDHVFRTLEDDCAGCRIGTDIVAAPHWPVNRVRIAGAAVNVLMPLFCSSPGYRIARLTSVPAASYRSARRNGHQPFHAIAASLRVTLLTVACGVAVLVQRIGMLTRSRWLTGLTRPLLWRRR